MQDQEDEPWGIDLTGVRIVAVNRFYRPDHAATAQMLTDLAEACVAAGATVSIITSRLGYDGAGGLPARETLAGVEVHRVWTSRFGRAHLLGRAIDYATFYLSAFVAMIALVRRGDLLIAKTDPPLISIVAAVAARLKGARLVNWCQDLFPEVAAALGMGWVKGPAGRVLEAVRNWSLGGAVLNVALHDTMARRLRAAGAPNIAVLPNWAPPELRRDDAGATAVRAAWGVAPSTFVLGYSGNLGRAHSPERIADLVRRTRDAPGLSWVFIGGGAGVDVVRREAGDAVQFRPYQPRAALAASLGAPDAHLVALSPECEGLIVPSKLYGVLAVGRPVVFLGAPDGAVAQDIAADPRSLVLDIDAPETWGPALDAHIAALQASPESQAPPYHARDALKAWLSAISRLRRA